MDRKKFFKVNKAQAHHRTAPKHKVTTYVFTGCASSCNDIGEAREHIP